MWWDKLNMKSKVLNYFEMTSVYIILLFIIKSLSFIVKLGNTKTEKIILSILVYAAIGAIPVITMCIRKIPLSTLGFSNKNIAKQLMVAIVIFIITISFVIIPLLFGVNKTEMLSFKSSSIGVLTFYIFYDLICIGFGEEIVFRGYFYSRIKSISSISWLPMLLSAILFGVIHFINTLSLGNVIGATVLGLIYGFFRWKVKNCSLLSLGIAHGLHDACILIMSYYLL